jgi:hypothetical protein
MATSPLSVLKIVIIRHGEKPEIGDNLSAQGLQRALQLPTVLYAKFGVPDHIYVPSLGMDVATSHSRMFQTVTPFAIQYNLRINSKFDEKDAAGLAAHVLEKTGTALMVWEHHMINPIVSSLGVADAPLWGDTDFDSIWIITFTPMGTPILTHDRQNLTPT